MSSCRPRPATSFATESRRAALSSTARGATRSCATSGVATNATHAASCLITAAGSSSLLDRDAAASEGCRGRRAVGRAGLVVVDHGAVAAPVPDFEAEPVHAAAAIHLAVDRSEHESVVTRAVDRSGSLELRLRSGHHEPVVGRTLEDQIGGLKAE